MLLGRIAPVSLTWHISFKKADIETKMDLVMATQLDIRKNALEIYTKPPECVNIIRNTLVPSKHESVGRVISGHQLGKSSDVNFGILA